MRPRPALAHFLAAAITVICCAGRTPAAPDTQPAAPADAELARQFDAIWGADLRRAAASPERADDVNLAAKIVEAARSLPQATRDDRRTKVYVLRRAQAVAMKDPSGYPTAAAVLDLLPGVDVELADDVAVERLDLDEATFRASPPGPQREALGRRVADDLMRAGLDHFTEKRLAAARKYFDRAERIATMSKSPRGPIAIVLLKLVDARAALTRAAEDLARTHAAQRKRETARKLVELNLIELDDPAEALRFLPDADDPELARLVPLADRRPAELSGPECLELANWLYDRRKTVSVSGVSVILTRARELYARYLAQDPPKTLETVRARQRLTEIADAVEKGEGVLLPKRRPAIDVANDTPATEAADVVRQAAGDNPDALAPFKKLRVVRVHDAAELRRNGGGPKPIPGAYATAAVEGGAPQIWLWGLYEPLDPGRYLILYRMRHDRALQGDNVCFVDVCANAATIAQNRPPGPAFPPGLWRAIPVALDLADRTTVEYRLWTHGHTYAVDRIYVLKEAP